MTSILSFQELLDELRIAWQDGVREDYLDGFLWDGETCIHASLSHHLRGNLLNKHKSLRVWHEIQLIENTRTDLVLGEVMDDAVIGKQHLCDDWSAMKTHVAIIAAIEVKYAPTRHPKWDIRKLRMIGRLNDGQIIPVLALLEGTGRSELDWLKSKCKKTPRNPGIILLYGISEEGHSKKDWTVEAY